MVRSFIKKGQALALIPWVSRDQNPYDNVIVDKNQVFADNSDLTGFQRLKNLFEPYLDHPVHPRIIDLMQTSLASFIAGGLYGAVTRSRATFIKFIETNEATQFRSHLDAKRKLADQMFLSFMRGFARWGLRVSFFCTTFLTTYTIVSVYRNKDSVLYYTLSGLSAGSLYKFPLGPKGMISGGFFGAFFGSVYGGVKFIELWFLNKTEEDLRLERFSNVAKGNQELSNTFRSIAYEDSKRELNQLIKGI